MQQLWHESLRSQPEEGETVQESSEANCLSCAALNSGNDYAFLADRTTEFALIGKCVSSISNSKQNLLMPCKFK